jgi:hypothetical protein
MRSPFTRGAKGRRVFQDRSHLAVRYSTFRCRRKGFYDSIIWVFTITLMLSARNSGGIGDSGRRRRRVRRAEKGAMLSSEQLEPKVLLTVVADSFEPK